MAVPCVRVERTEGEAVRSRLDAAGLLDRTHEIEAEDGWLYIPVTDPEGVDERVVERQPPAREGRTLPADTLGFEPTYERLGDLVLLEEPADRAERVADAIVASDVPARAVLNRASKVKGTERVRDWDVVRVVDDGADDGGTAGTGDDSAGFGPTETIHREYGHEFHVDVDRAYFSPRLATERRRVVDQVEPGEHAVDMFAGVGPIAIQLATAGASVVAADVNPDAVELLAENAERNGVADRVTVHEGDVRELLPEHAGTADRLVMNLPHDADDFLDAAVELADDEAVVHYYDIQPDDDPFGPGERAIRAAASGYEVEVLDRRTVKSYAPHESNVVIDARLDQTTRDG